MGWRGLMAGHRTRLQEVFSGAQPLLHRALLVPSVPKSHGLVPSPASLLLPSQHLHYFYP